MEKELLRGVSALGNGTFVRETYGRVGMVLGGNGAGGMSAVALHVSGRGSLHAYENTSLTPVAKGEVNKSEARILHAVATTFFERSDDQTRIRLLEVSVVTLMQHDIEMRRRVAVLEDRNAAPSTETAN